MEQSARGKFYERIAALPFAARGLFESVASQDLAEVCYRLDLNEVKTFFYTVRDHKIVLCQFVKFRCMLEKTFW